MNLSRHVAAHQSTLRGLKCTLSLQKNMYDGLMIAAETLKSCNFAEVCNYVTYIDFWYLSGPGYYMNLDTYNSLPDDLKAIIDDADMIGGGTGKLRRWNCFGADFH